VLAAGVTEALSLVAEQMLYDCSPLPAALTGAVTQAVRERLDRLHRERDGRLADRLLRIGKDCAARLKEPFRSADHGDLLYDKRGLPR
jgi:antitoxin VapB